MGRSNNHGADYSVDHGVLAALEVVAVPLAVLGTMIVLALAGSAIAATRYLGSAAGVPSIAVDLAVWGIGALTAGLLLSWGGMTVGEYRRFLTVPDRTLHPAVLGAVPFVGVVGPYAYALYTSGSLALSAPLFVVVVLSAHALAFRAIAWVARRDRHRREGLLAGTLAGVPVTLALVSFVTDHLLGPLVDEAGQLLLGAIGPTLVPRSPLSLVAVPLAVSLLYGAYRAAVDRSLIEPVTAPAAVERAPRVPNLIRVSRRRVTPALARARNLASHRLSAAGSSASRRGPTEGPSVPTPPRSARSSEDRPRSGTTGADETVGVPRPPRSASAGRAAGAATDGERANSSDGHDDADSPDADSADDEPGGDPVDGDGPDDDPGDADSPDSDTNRERDREDETETDDESPAEDEPTVEDESTEADATTEEGTTTEDASGSDEVGDQDDAAGAREPAGEDSRSDAPGQFASDTQIFSADASPADGEGTSIDTCPDCGEDLPSDGTFEFCPICGNEL